MADQSANRQGRQGSAPGRGQFRGAKSDQSNRLFSALKGAGGVPSQQGSVGDVSQTQTEGGVPTGARKRNRSRSNKTESEPKKPSSTANATEVDVSGEMDVESAVDASLPKEKPAYLTDFEFQNQDISENSKRALIEKMNIRYVLITYLS